MITSMRPSGCAVTWPARFAAAAPVAISM